MTWYERRYQRCLTEDGFLVTGRTLELDWYLRNAKIWGTGPYLPTDMDRLKGPRYLDIKTGRAQHGVRGGGASATKPAITR